MISFFKKFIKAIARIVSEAQIITLLSRAIDHNKRYHLIKQLKSCGSDFSIYMPLIIQNPENVEIGDQVSIAPFVHMWGLGGIKIGSRVMIASHCAITSLTHDYTHEHMHTTQLHGLVCIEDDVWIGAHSVILPGITIGRGAVIGGGAIVTHDVAPFTIVVGSPARLHKKRLTTKGG